MLLERALVHTAASRACDVMKDPTAAKHHHQRAIELNLERGNIVEAAALQRERDRGLMTVRPESRHRRRSSPPSGEKLRTASVLSSALVPSELASGPMPMSGT